MTEKQVIIGVTGGLASGKSITADAFVAKGAVRIDADGIAHELLKENDRIKKEVVDLFGESVLSGGEVDRRKLAGEVFSDKGKLESLCRVLHPEIISRIQEEVSLHPGKIIVVDAPLLVEVGLNEYVDIVVVVTASHETQVARAMDRGVSQEEAESIILSQMPLPEKEKFADYVINNDGKKEKIKEGVERIWQKI